MHIVLSPDLGLNAEQFAALWEADDEAQQIASASLESQQQQFAISPEVLVVALSFVAGVAGAAVTAAATETTKLLIQKWFAEKKPDEPKLDVEFLEKKVEDGTPMLVVVVKNN